MKKILLYGFLSLFAAAALVLVGYIYLQNANYKQTAMAEAGKLTGVTVDCTGFTFNPLTKTLSIRNLRLGNPSKYKTLYAAQVSQVLVVFADLDLEQRRFLISDIQLKDTYLNYEVDGLLENNLGDILAYVGKTPEGEQTSLRVQSLRFLPISISLNSVRYKREVANLTTPGFTLTGIGGESALTAREFVRQVLASVLLHGVSSISRDTTAKVDPQFRRGANDMLGTLVREHPELARDLKL